MEKLANIAGGKVAEPLEKYLDHLEIADKKERASIIKENWKNNPEADIMCIYKLL
jgi:hypothetical protein